MSCINVLCYAWNHEGLGHTNRLLAVLRGIQELRQDATYFIFAEQESPLLRSAGWPFVCVPSFPNSYKGSWGEQAIEAQETVLVKAAIASAQVEATLEHFCPHIIIHDTVLWAPLFDTAVARRIPQVLIIRRRKDMRVFLESMRSELAHVAAIILPHRSSEVSQEELPEELRDRVSFSGSILRTDRADIDIAALRQKYGMTPAARTILITGGGGGYTEHQHFYTTVIDALASACTQPTLGILVTGYFYTGVTSFPPAMNVTWRVTSHEDRLPDLMAAADLVITQVGYNTINELLMIQAPALLVPGPRPFDDQILRAHQVAALFGRARVVEQLSVSQIQAALTALLSDQTVRPEPMLVEADGRRRCAQTILDLL